MDLYLFLRGLHNLVRWLVVLGGVWALAQVAHGFVTGAAWTARDRISGAIFSGFLLLNVLIGLVLYVVSPVTRAAMGDMGAAMGQEELRFFAVEHLLMMLLAAVAAQLGFSLSKRAPTDRARFTRALIGYGLAALLLVVGVPWWRSLVPWVSSG